MNSTRLTGTFTWRNQEQLRSQRAEKNYAGLVAAIGPDVLTVLGSDDCIALALR